MGAGSSRLNDRAIELYLSSQTPQGLTPANKKDINIKALPKGLKKSILQLINKNSTLKKQIYNKAKNQLQYENQIKDLQKKSEKYQNSKTWKKIEKRQGNSKVYPMPPVSSVTRKNNAANNAAARNALTEAHRRARNLTNIGSTRKQLAIQPNTTRKYMNGRINSYILQAARELVESQAPEGLAGEDLDKWIENTIYSRLEEGKWSNINNDNTRNQLMGYKKSLWGRKSNQNRSNAAKVAAYGLKSALTVADPNMDDKAVKEATIKKWMTGLVSDFINAQNARKELATAKKNGESPEKIKEKEDIVNILWNMDLYNRVKDILVPDFIPTKKDFALLFTEMVSKKGYNIPFKGNPFLKGNPKYKFLFPTPTKPSTNGSTNSTAP